MIHYLDCECYFPGQLPPLLAFFPSLTFVLLEMRLDRLLALLQCTNIKMWCSMCFPFVGYYWNDLPKAGILGFVWAIWLFNLKKVGQVLHIPPIIILSVVPSVPPPPLYISFFYCITNDSNKNGDAHNFVIWHFQIYYRRSSWSFLPLTLAEQDLSIVGMPFIAHDQHLLSGRLFKSDRKFKNLFYFHLQLVMLMINIL